MTATQMPSDSLAGGRYELGEVIGTGGMAAVYLAWDTLLCQHRAIKVMLPALTNKEGFKKRFMREARAMADLEHPNVVRIYDVGSNGRQFIVMEVVRCKSLIDRIRMFGALGPRWSTDVCIALLGALHKAHERGMVHRDVKPHNVLLDEDDVPKLTDFGIVQVQSTQTDAGLTKVGTPMGTWGFMDPQQIKDGADVDARCDIFAMGTMLFCMLAGREDPLDLQSSELEPEMLDVVPEMFREVIYTATRYRREDRYESAAEMARALRELRETLPEDEQPLPVIEPIKLTRPGEEVAGEVSEDQGGASEVETPSEPGEPCGYTMVPAGPVDPDEDDKGDVQEAPRSRGGSKVKMLAAAAVLFLCLMGGLGVVAASVAKRLGGDAQVVQTDAAQNDPVAILASSGDIPPIEEPTVTAEFEESQEPTEPENDTSEEIEEEVAVATVEPEGETEPELKVHVPTLVSTQVRESEPGPVKERVMIPLPEPGMPGAIMVSVEPEGETEPKPEPKPVVDPEPSLMHTPVDIVAGEQITVMASAPSSYQLMLYYRPSGTGAYKNMPMRYRSGAFSAAIPWSDAIASSGGLDYRIVATSKEGGAELKSPAGMRPHKASIQ